MSIRNILIFLLAFGFAVSANAAKAIKKTNRTRKARVVKTIADHSINLNKADANVLASVKGIGPKKAKAIVNYRNAKGKFKSVKDLTNVRGIGDKRLAKIGKYLTV
jgi:competence protein ComEA